MKIAACYIRVSTDDQLEYSPDSQLEKIREYAKRNNMILPEENIFIEEEGISGRKAAKRHEFQRMIATAKSKPKPFDTILVWKFSRFARNREDSIVYK
ncbi:MAG: recombinase family protein, partial [Ruminiclostridium sp.]|nr:recombinase family protein [Ruminiclostridium sp.]